MAEKELNPEEQKLRVRRRLLKLAVYSIPAIATVLATEEAYADGEGEGEGDDHRAGRGIKTKRKKPNGPKKYKKGLS